METSQVNKTTSGVKQILSALNLTPLGVGALAALAILPLIPPFNQEYLIRWLVIGVFMAAQAVAFDFTSGYINIVNFGFAAFVGLGAYTSGIMAVRLGVPPWIGIFLGIIPAALLGFFTGVITLRLRGMFAAVMAWFLGLALMGLTVKLVFLTQGPLGLNCPALLDTKSNLPYFYIVYVMFILIYVVLSRVVHSPIGMAFKAIGQNMEAARTSGISPQFYRIFNFTLSCAVAGWLGGFYAHYMGVLTPDVMDVGKTVEILVIVYIGGRGSLWGGAVAAIPFYFAMELVRSSLSQYPGLNLIFYSLFLILIMIYYPGGLAHLYDTIAQRFRHNGGADPLNIIADPETPRC